MKNFRLGNIFVMMYVKKDLYLRLIRFYISYHDTTASAVTCVRNDRICDMILQSYPSDLCKITPLSLTKTRTKNLEMQFGPFCINLKMTLRKVTPTTSRVIGKKFNYYIYTLHLHMATSFFHIYL